MSNYQVIARKFRPQYFKEVIGQEAIVITLKNAIKFKRLAQAYLFCGSRGTGKTTLARIFAKALNCQNLTPEQEPCNTCASCREITAGSSLDVLEIDGASHRGIEDIRQINETVGYSSSSGGYKIYIIDEVHMLTKEAFNALLKTLEEPPSQVKFLFATTEPHKVLPTILSRCQRFTLNRIPLDKITKKLAFISEQLGVEVEEEALYFLARQAEGGLRDAESLLDQMTAFVDGKITLSSVNTILGLMPKEAYFELDQAGKEGHLAKAFELSHQLFTQGKDLIHFVEGLIEHFRTILLIKLAGKEAPFLALSQIEKEKYETTARLYTQEQCLNLIDYLIEAQNQIRFAPSAKVALEAILLHIMRSHFRLPIEYLVRRLSELEKAITPLAEAVPSVPLPIPPPPPIAIVTKPAIKPEPSTPKVPPATPKIVPSISEDPTPTPADLGIKTKTPKPLPIEPPPPVSSPLDHKKKKPAHHYDTLLHFAAVELEGKIQKNK